MSEREHNCFDGGEVASLPSPLRTLLCKFDADTQPFRKAHRLVDNLAEWISSIVDEVDREEIAVWAKSVVSGKMTTEQFAELVKPVLGNVTSGG